MTSAAEGVSSSPENDSPWFMRTKRLGFGIRRADDFELALRLWGDARGTRLIDARSPPPGAGFASA
ncbi:MAG TPA: hypothetical protein VHI13_19995 [Candidatus Kapabacteria bacterium]|nr:hypothetical protein [Candidatus Kapabacteria bacterium]